MAATHRLVFLHAEMTSRPEYRSRIDSAKHIIAVRGLEGKTLAVDGSDPAQKGLRNA